MTEPILAIQNLRAGGRTRDLKGIDLTIHVGETTRSWAERQRQEHARGDPGRPRRL